MKALLVVKLSLVVVGGLVLAGNASADTLKFTHENEARSSFKAASEFASVGCFACGGEEGTSLKDVKVFEFWQFTLPSVDKKWDWELAGWGGDGKYRVTWPTGTSTTGDPGKAAEPASGLLVGLGLAVAGLVSRRKKKPVDTTVWESLA